MLFRSEQGLIDAVGAEELKRYGTIERDPHGHLRLGEIEFGRLIRDRISSRAAELGIKITMIDKDLGYELRCADPIPFDAEYTRDLGYGAVKFLLGGESAKYGAVISIVGGKLVPLAFDSIIDPATSRMRSRKVDVDSVTYECARQYMIRLEKDDFSNPAKLKKLADTVKMTPEQFAERLGGVVK